MATLGHVAVGLVAGRLHLMAAPEPSAWRRLGVLVGYAALSMVPDLDVIGFRLGVRYADVWGHRGAAHSLLFALGVALVFALAYAQADPRPRFATVCLLAFLAVGSHGLLDTLTNGGLGAELLWPFSHQRYFAPIAIIPVAPIGRGMLSRRGLSILGYEALLFLPLWLFALWPRRGAGFLRLSSREARKAGSRSEG